MVRGGSVDAKGRGPGGVVEVKEHAESQEKAVGDKVTFESVKGGGRWSKKFGVWKLKEAIGIVEMEVAQGAHTEDVGEVESREEGGKRGRGERSARGHSRERSRKRRKLALKR